MEGLGMKPFINGRGRPGSRNLPQNSRQKRPKYFTPILSFSNPEEYVRVLSEAAQEEFKIEEAAILKFNQENEFDCWPLFFKKCDPRFHHWIVIVRMGAVECEVFPEPGDRCEIRLNTQTLGLKLNDPKWMECSRIDNPINNFALQCYDGTSLWGGFAAFQVAIPSHWGQRDPKPFDVLPLHTRGNDELPVVSLNSETKLSANLRLRISDTTKSVELQALRLAPNVSREAFLYLLEFDNPMYSTNLFDHCPHMQNPDAEGSQLSEACKAWFRNLHADQKRTYSTLLESLSCGIGFIHGASGTGKTHLALTIAAMAQAAPIAHEAASKPLQVLFLMAKNRPLTDATNKMVEIYKQLGMNNMEYMRVYNFNYELKYSRGGPEKYSTFSGVNDNQNAEFIDFEDVFQRTRPVYAPQIRTGRRTDCLAPTLREACEKLYNVRYKHDALPSRSSIDGENYESEVSSFCEENWLSVVKDKLASTHFIATTPVGASKMASFAEGAFDPVIVIIDDAS